MDPRVARIVSLFEGFKPEDLPRIAEVYTDDAYFKDPFNEVRGAAAIRGIFEHMFRSLDGPRFVVRDTLVDGDQCFLGWDFVFRPKRAGSGGGEIVVRGSSHLKLAADGRIAWHRDYWDAAEELYEKLPLLGALMRWLKRRVNSG
jgi:ketosteroid isomerase-like protein